MRESTNKLKRNKLLYSLVFTVIIIIFLVIFLSGTYLKKQIYIDIIPKQPMNNIRSINNEEDIFAYTFTEDKTYGNYIYLTNQFPIKDEVGESLEGQFKTFDFKLEFSEKSLGLNYDITLEKMEGTNLFDDWVKIYLTREGTGINCYRNTGRIKTYNEYSKYSDKEILLYKGIVTKADIQKGYREYRFRMWVSEDVRVFNENYEKRSFIARVNVHAKIEK